MEHAGAGDTAIVITIIVCGTILVMTVVLALFTDFFEPRKRK